MTKKTFILSLLSCLSALFLFQADMQAAMTAPIASPVPETAPKASLVPEVQHHAGEMPLKTFPAVDAMPSMADQVGEETKEWVKNLFSQMEAVIPNLTADAQPFFIRIGEDPGTWMRDEKQKSKIIGFCTGVGQNCKTFTTIIAENACNKPSLQWQEGVQQSYVILSCK